MMARVQMGATSRLRQGFRDTTLTDTWTFGHNGKSCLADSCIDMICDLECTLINLLSLHEIWWCFAKVFALGTL